MKISRYCKICSTTLMDGCCCCTRRLQPPRPIRKRKADDVNYVLWPRFSKKIDLNPLYSFFFYFLFVFSLSSSLCLQLCCVLILAKNAAFRSRKWKNIGKGRLSSSSFFFCRMSQKVIFIVETTIRLYKFQCHHLLVIISLGSGINHTFREHFECIMINSNVTIGK